jgi:hypothetical protein
MDGGVYNRSLFRRKESARDGLSRMGGIMAASPELMAAAEEMMPVQTGQGRVLFQAPSIVGAMPGMPMPMGQPMPMQPRPQAPMMAQPQPMPMAPPQPQPMPMQPQPQMRFQEGGIVDLAAQGSRGRNAPRVLEPRTFDQPIAAPAAPASAAVGGPTAVADTMAQIQELLDDPAASPTTQAEVILDEVADDVGIEPTGDTQEDLVAAAEALGIPNAREQRVDQLNRAITGAAIAAGTSPSAAENIANGMLKGLQLQRADELRRIAADAAQLQALQGGEQGANWFDTPRGKIASDYIETMMGAERDIETIIDELNRLDANSPAGARLGDEFRMALASGATPPAMPGMAAPPAAPAAGEEAAQPVDMNRLVTDARNYLGQIDSNPNLSEAQKNAAREAVRQRFVEMGGNPALLSSR